MADKLTATVRLTFDVLFDDNGEDDHVTQALAEAREISPRELIRRCEMEVIHVQRPEETKDV